jgi:hypothetical protein
MSERLLNPFDRAIRSQIELNLARTPDERFHALCRLLDDARAMAPRDDESRSRRKLALSAHQLEREKWREQWRRLAAAERLGASAGL